MCDFLGGMFHCSNGRPHIQQYVISTNYTDVETKDTMIARNGKKDKSWKNWRRESSYTQNTVENLKTVLSVATLGEDWLDLIVLEGVTHSTWNNHQSYTPMNTVSLTSHASIYNNDMNMRE